MQRIRSLDLARGFTVLFIPAIHVGMLYSRLSVHHSWSGHFLIAIAEGPGGQLLMLLMGVSITFKTIHSFRNVLIRSISLLSVGYLLNILKFVVPYCCGCLPEIVLQKLNISNSCSIVWQLTGIGDIMHFAAIGLLLTHLVYKVRNYQWLAFIIAVIVILISPWLWDKTIGIPLFDYVIQLFTGQPPRVFFPIFPWLVYPMIGLIIGYALKQDTNRTMKRCAFLGIALLSAGLWLGKYYPVENPAGFYRTYPAATLWHLGIVLISLYVWHLASKFIGDNYFFTILTYCSKNITIIYVIQWILICWMLPVFGYQDLDLAISAIVMIAMTVNTYLLTLSFQIIQQLYGYK